MMERTFFRIVSFVMLFFCLDARGADDVTDQAAEHFKKGVDLFKDNLKEEAVREFQTAYDLKPAWKIKYNIGQCQAALRRYGLAIEAFERYLGEGGDEVSEERRDEVITELDRLRKMVGSVRISAPPGYVILIDGIKRGDTPTSSSILVTAGIDHEISVERDDEVILSVKETVSGGEMLELTATAPEEETPVAVVGGVEPVSETLADETAAPQTVPEETVAPPPTVSQAETTPPEKTPEPQDGPVSTTPARRKPFGPAVLIVGASAAVIFGGAAGGFAVAVNAKWERSEKDIDEDPWGTKADAVTFNIRTMQIVSWACLGLSGVGLILTAVAIPLTRWGGDKSNASAGVTLSPFQIPSGGGLALSGRF